MEGRFGPYEPIRLLGRGGMGEVHAALDTEQERTIALKRLLPHLADDEEFQKRFRRESRTAARLASPHVIPIHRSGEIDGRLFLDMRLVEGHDLEQLLARDTHLEPGRVVTIVEQVASALDAAHHAGLVHRDVKPSNVLLDTAVGANDFVYLVDFGITRAFGDESQALTSTHAVVGSLDYMAPEQFEGAADPSIDVYSLGCLLFQTLTGSRPFPVEGFPALMRAHLSVPPPSPSHLRPALGTAFDEVVACALAKDPQERYPSAGALAAAARTALETAAGAGTDRWTDPGPRPSSGTERSPAARSSSSGPRPPMGPARPPTPPRPWTAPQAPERPAARGPRPSGPPRVPTPTGSAEARTGLLSQAGGVDSATSTMSPARSAPARPPEPAPGGPHPSFPYPAVPPEAEAPPAGDHPPVDAPFDEELVPQEPAPSGTGRRLLMVVLLLLVLAVGVLAGRIAVAWATGGSPLGSLLGAGAELVTGVAAPVVA